MKLRHALPIAQMALAAILLWSNRLWQQSILQGSHVSTFAPLPTFIVLVGVNAPVGLARLLWFKHVPSPWEDILLIPAAGVLWYWMALNIQMWREERSVCMFHWLPLRVVGDLLLVGIGGVLGHGIFEEFKRATRANQLSFFEVSSGMLFVAWAGFLILFFGRDLIIGFRSAARRLV